MIKLLIVRHAKTEWNKTGRIQGRSDIPLAPESRDATRAAACSIGHIDAAYCSPLSRARETAEILAEGKGVEPVPDDRLTERDFGEYEGRTYDELGLPDHTKLFYALSCAKGAESSEAVFDRVRSFLRDVAEKHEGQTVLIVSHGVCISYLLYALTHERFDERDYSMGYIKNLDVTEKEYRL